MAREEIRSSWDRDTRCPLEVLAPDSEPLAAPNTLVLATLERQLVRLQFAWLLLGLAIQPLVPPLAPIDGPKQSQFHIMSIHEQKHKAD